MWLTDWVIYRVLRYLVVNMLSDVVYANIQDPTVAIISFKYRSGLYMAQSYFAWGARYYQLTAPSTRLYLFITRAWICFNVNVWFGVLRPFFWRDLSVSQKLKTLWHWLRPDFMEPVLSSSFQWWLRGIWSIMDTVGHWSSNIFNVGYRTIDVGYAYMSCLQMVSATM